MCNFSSWLGGSCCFKFPCEWWSNPRVKLQDHQDLSLLDTVGWHHHFHAIYCQHRTTYHYTIIYYYTVTIIHIYSIIGYCCSDIEHSDIVLCEITFFQSRKHNPSIICLVKSQNFDPLVMTFTVRHGFSMADRNRWFT